MTTTKDDDEMRTIRQAATLLALLSLSGCAEEFARIKAQREAELRRNISANTMRCSANGTDTMCYLGGRLVSEAHCKNNPLTGIACTTATYPTVDIRTA